ncbi:MAG: hypothetical protein KAX44_06665 [Candidatus Brocadiae bacterium]|nr:hypothetical protein [Candidatus Brocadiia bacterium]
MGNQGSDRRTPARHATRVLSLLRARPGLSLGVVACVVVAALAVVSVLYETERDKVLAALVGVRKAVEKGDAQEALAHVSPYFCEEGLYRAQLTRGLERALRSKPVSRASLVVRQLSMAGSAAVVLVHVESHRHRGVGGGMARSEWRVTLEKIEGRWLIRGATPLQVNDRKVAGLRSVLAMGY